MTQTKRAIKKANRIFLRVTKLLILLAFVLGVLLPLGKAQASSPTIGLTGTGSTSYPTAKVITANGATISTSQSKFGGASGSFARASSQYLYTPDSPDWYFGSGDFTIDTWVYFSVLPINGDYSVISSQWQDANNEWNYFLYNIGGTYYWYFQNRTGSTSYNINVNAATTVSTGAWYHIAVVHSGTNWYFYQNGARLTTTITSNDNVVGDHAAELHICSGYVDGYIDEFRISKGIARWTGTTYTTPTARYDRDSYDVLLLHMDGTNGSTTFLDDVTTGQAKATKVTLPDNNAAIPTCPKNMYQLLC